MAIRKSLIEAWQKRFNLGLQLSHDPSPRLRTVGRIYVRVYRFLLSTYGAQPWGTDPELPPADELQVNAPPNIEPVSFLGDELSGAPAKPTERIRVALDRIQIANEASGSSESLAASPASGGMGAADWFTVATEGGRVCPIECVELFRQHKIVARIAGRGRQRTIEVPFCHREQAFALLREFPNRIHPRGRDTIKNRILKNLDQKDSLAVAALAMATWVIGILVLVVIIGLVVSVFTMTGIGR